MSILPVELYRPILQHVHRPRDLISLALTSSVLYAEAERQLYRNIQILDITANVTDRQTRDAIQTQIFSALVSNPRFTSHIHTLSLMIPPDMGGLFSDVLISTINIKRLAINAISLDFNHCRRPILFLNPHAKLEYLELRTLYGLHEQDCSLIEAQTELTELNWFCLHLISTGDALDVRLPKLRIVALRGRAAGKATLLQHHVTHLHQEWGFNFYDTDDDLTSVRSLKLTNPVRAEHVKYFPTLQYIWTTGTVSPGVMVLLKHLIKISVSIGQSHLTPPFQTSRHYADTLFKFSDSLKQVQVRGILFVWEFEREGSENEGELQAKPLDEDEWRKF